MLCLQKGRPLCLSFDVFFGNSRDEDRIECPHYILHSTGARVGCHFDALPEPRPTDTYVFLVNGTSKEAGIQFVDFPPFKAIQMGKAASRLVLVPLREASWVTVSWVVPTFLWAAFRVPDRP